MTAGIVLDNSASMAPKQSEVIAAALAFARASNPRDEMFVVHFNDLARFGLPPGEAFTGNVKELEAAISRFRLGGTTALYDAIMLAQTRFNRAAYPGRALLVITDGGDNSSIALSQRSSRRFCMPARSSFRSASMTRPIPMPILPCWRNWRR